MRIESTANRNGKSTLHAKKKHTKHKKENNHSSNTESLELSDEAKLLNKLLHASSNEFIPFPFYFINAAARNVKQACTISKKIQNQADSLGILLNYSMIYDMVTNLATQNYLNNIQWTTTITAEYEALNNLEKSLFENLHNACLNNQISVNTIESAALEYIQIKQNRAENLPNRRECAKIIIDHLKKEPILKHNNINRSLSEIIKQFIINQDVFSQTTSKQPKPNRPDSKQSTSNPNTLQIKEPETL